MIIFHKLCTIYFIMQAAGGGHFRKPHRFGVPFAISDWTPRAQAFKNEILIMQKMTRIMHVQIHCKIIMQSLCKTLCKVYAFSVTFAGGASPTGCRGTRPDKWGDNSSSSIKHTMGRTLAERDEDRRGYLWQCRGIRVRQAGRLRQSLWSTNTNTPKTAIILSGDVGFVLWEQYVKTWVVGLMYWPIRGGCKCAKHSDLIFTKIQHSAGGFLFKIVNALTLQVFDEMYLWSTPLLLYRKSLPASSR
jgi:hypothetical protein